MSDDNLRILVAQGLKTMQAGSAVAAAATQEIRDDVSSPELREALEKGSKQAQTWSDRIDRALAEIGGAPEEHGNPVLEAHYDASRQIRRKAPDDHTRDLGIIAGGQEALHYWIAGFGTIRNYAQKLGLDQIAADFRQSAEEAKQADQEHTGLAERLLKQDAFA